MRWKLLICICVGILIILGSFYFYNNKLSNINQQLINPNQKTLTLLKETLNNTNNSDYKTIDTNYISFVVPKYATHYWNPNGNDTYEVLINATIKLISKTYTFKINWADDRYIDDDVNINYSFANGLLNSNGIKPYSLLKNSKLKFKNLTASYLDNNGNFQPVNINIGLPLSFVATDDINVSACGTLAVNNTVYNLNQSINFTGACLTIAGKNITLNGNNYTLTATNPSGSIGIYLNANSSVINNITILRSQYGIYYSQVLAVNDTIKNTYIINSTISDIVPNIGDLRSCNLNLTNVHGTPQSCPDTWGVCPFGSNPDQILWIANTNNMSVNNLTASQIILCNVTGGSMNNVLMTNYHQNNYFYLINVNNTVITNFTKRNTYQTSFSNIGNNTIINSVFDGSNANGYELYFTGVNNYNNFTNITIGKLSSPVYPININSATSQYNIFNFFNITFGTTVQNVLNSLGSNNNFTNWVISNESQSVATMITLGTGDNNLLANMSLVGYRGGMDTTCINTNGNMTLVNVNISYCMIGTYMGRNINLTNVIFNGNAWDIYNLANCPNSMFFNNIVLSSGGTQAYFYNNSNNNSVINNLNLGKGLIFDCSNNLTFNNLTMDDARNGSNGFVFSTVGTLGYITLNNFTNKNNRIALGINSSVNTFNVTFDKIINNEAFYCVGNCNISNGYFYNGNVFMNSTTGFNYLNNLTSYNNTNSTANNGVITLTNGFTWLNNSVFNNLTGQEVACNNCTIYITDTKISNFKTFTNNGTVTITNSSSGSILLPVMSTIKNLYGNSSSIVQISLNSFFVNATAYPSLNQLSYVNYTNILGYDSAFINYNGVCNSTTVPNCTSGLPLNYLKNNIIRITNWTNYTLSINGTILNTTENILATSFNLNISTNYPYNSLLFYLPLDTIPPVDLSNFNRSINNSGSIFNPNCLYNGCYTNFTTFSSKLNMSTIADPVELTSHAWININPNGTMPIGTSATERQIVGKASATTTLDWFMGIDKTTNRTICYFQLSGGAVRLAGSTKVVDGNWHMIDCTYNGSRVSVYVDGTLQNSSAGSGTITNSANPINIGSGGNTATYARPLGVPSFVDEVMVFNDSLDQSNITNLYNNKSSRFNQGTFYFNQTTGTNIGLTLNMSNPLDYFSIVSIGTWNGTNFNYGTEKNLTNYLNGYQNSFTTSSGTISIKLQLNSSTYFLSPTINTFISDYWSGNVTGSCWIKTGTGRGSILYIPTGCLYQVNKGNIG